MNKGKYKLEQSIEDLELTIDAIRDIVEVKGNEKLLNDGHTLHYICEIEDDVDFLAEKVSYLMRAVQDRVEAGE